MNQVKQVIDIVKYRFFWLLVSAVLIIPGIVAMVYSSATYDTHYPLKVGIDFTGGTILQYAVKSEIPSSEVSKIRVNLENNGIENPYIQIINTSSSASKNNSDIKSIISIRTKFIDEKNMAEADKITSVVKKDYTDAQLVQTSSIGPTLGGELFTNSMFALLLAFLGIVVYLTIRFQLDFAVSAVLAILHDVLFIIGTFSIFGLVFNMQIDGLFITALLTVIGFSVHDTIVVFDRIRENLRYYSKKMSFSEIINLSINQTLARSINTSMTTLITLGALYFFGGVTTKDFVLAMILGIATGTYSSIFFASVILDIWRERKTIKK